MNTSFQPVTVRADKIALTDAAKRASSAKTDAEKEARFADLLPDRKAKQASESDRAVRANAMRSAPNEPERADRKNPAAVPAQAISIQQAVLAASVQADPTPEAAAADVATPDAAATAEINSDRKAGASSPGIEPHGPPPTDGDDGTMVTGGIKAPPAEPHAPPLNPAADVVGTAFTGGTKTPQIEPHGPPVVPTVGDGDTKLTGGIKAPPVEPHDPPVVPVDDGGDQMLTGGIKAPHGPPVVSPDDRATQPTAVTSVQDKPLVIRPHGPVNPPTTQFAGREDAPEITGSDPAPTPLLVASNDPQLGHVVGWRDPSTPASPTPAVWTNLASTAIPSGPAKREEAALPAVQENVSPSAASADSSRTEGSTSPAFLVTTATQAQFAANTANAETVVGTNPGSANLAAPLPSTPEGAPDRKAFGYSQVNKREGVTSTLITGGTAVAKRLDSMTALPSDPATAAERDASSTRDEDGYAAVGATDRLTSERLSGRAKDGDAAKASFSVTSAPDTVASAPTTVADTVSAAPSTGIVRVDKVETLLQTVQETAERVRFDGAGQVELRVRLDGAAGDVTVRVHLDQNQQPQVSFQTGSPELRAALEQGWSDLKTSEPTASESAFELPATRPMADPAASTSFRDGRRIFSAPSSADRGQAARRWSGYA